MRLCVIGCLLWISPLSGNNELLPRPKVQAIQPDRATIIEIIPLSSVDLIRIDGNYENNLAPGVVCIVSDGEVVKGEVIIIHTRIKTAYGLITKFSGQGDFIPGDRITPKRSITF